MLSRFHSLGSCLIVLTLLLFAGSAAAQDVSPRCEAEMDRAAGHYSKCLLSADASYARHENATKLENRQARCETRFERRAARAINRHGEDECASADLVTAMADRAVSYAAGIATEASGAPSPSFLFVQNADGGTLTNTTLTLTGVSDQTGYFSDRPYRLAGQIPTEGLLSGWDEGGSSFADDPPNAAFVCEVADEVVNYIVELTSASMVGDDLTYSVAAVGDTVLPQEAITCNADPHLFIDNKGCDGGTHRPPLCCCGHDSECGSNYCALAPWYSIGGTIAYQGADMHMVWGCKGMCSFGPRPD